MALTQSTRVSVTDLSHYQQQTMPKTLSHVCCMIHICLYSEQQLSDVTMSFMSSKDQGCHIILYRKNSIDLYHDSVNMPRPPLYWTTHMTSHTEASLLNGYLDYVLMIIEVTVLHTKLWWSTSSLITVTVCARHLLRAMILRVLCTYIHICIAILTYYITV